MKNLKIVALFILFTSVLFAQKIEEEYEQKESRHEIGLDLLDFAKYRRVELSYNHIFNVSST